MISKKIFVETIEAIKREREFQDRFNELLGTYCEDSLFMHYHLEDTILKLLEEIFNDKAEWLIYAFYKLDFLDKYKPGCCNYKDGSEIDISTWDKLYDFLVKNMEESK